MPPKRKARNIEAFFEKDAELVSRSQRKRDSSALQKLAEEITRLGPKQWDKLPLSDEFLEALRLWHSIADREGRRRQLQFLGRLMRTADSCAIENAMRTLRDGKNAENVLVQRAERLREALLQADAAERTRLLAAMPELAARVQELLEAVQRDNGPPAKNAYRALFRLLLDAQNVDGGDTNVQKHSN